MPTPIEVSLKESRLCVILQPLSMRLLIAHLSCASEKLVSFLRYFEGAGVPLVRHQQ